MAITSQANIYSVIMIEQYIHFHSNIWHSVLVLIHVKGLDHATQLTRFKSIAQAGLLHLFFGFTEKNSKVTIPDV